MSDYDVLLHCTSENSLELSQHTGVYNSMFKAGTTHHAASGFYFLIGNGNRYTFINNEIIKE